MDEPALVSMVTGPRKPGAVSQCVAGARRRGVGSVLEFAVRLHAALWQVDVDRESPQSSALKELAARGLAACKTLGLPSKPQASLVRVERGTKGLPVPQFHF